VNITSLDQCICTVGHYHAYNSKAHGGVESYSEDETGVLYKNHVFVTGIGSLIVLRPVALTMTCNGELTQAEPALYEPGEYPIQMTDVSCLLPFVISYPVDTRFNASETTTYFQCKPCLPGTFSDLAGMDMCSACPAGSYQDAPGGDTCKPCEPGSTSETDGASRCTPCPAGGFHAEDLNTCETCAAGTYSGAAGGTGCTECDENTWSDAGASACHACPYWSTGGGAGVTACTCQDGTYLDLSEPENPFCRLCGPGMFAPSRSNMCLPCNNGTFNGWTAQVACAPCPLNASSAGIRATACVPCALGETRTPDGGACETCPAGAICLPSGERTSCPPGQASLEEGLYSTDQCSTCPANKVCIAGSTIPEECPEHTHSEPGATSMLNCVCDPDYECSYVKSTRLKVLLPYSVEQFETMRLDFIRAVAEAAGVELDRVKIVYVRDMSGQRNRRSLWSMRARKPFLNKDDEEEALLVRVRVMGKLTAMRGLDHTLSRRGIRGTMDGLPTGEKRDHRVVVWRRMNGRLALAGTILPGRNSTV
jgi:hypothetical protein